MVKRSDTAKTFHLLPKRWIVERIYGSLVASRNANDLAGGRRRKCRQWAIHHYHRLWLSYQRLHWANTVHLVGKLHFLFSPHPYLYCVGCVRLHFKSHRCQSSIWEGC
jgi:hypothetical protein